MVKRMENDKYNCARWLCDCECGNQTIVDAKHLKSGHTKSCGCYNREHTGEMRRTHGLSNTPTYNVWLGIKNRCENPHEIGYKNYGGRGIKVCDEWHSFENFLRDMGEKPKGMSIERKDNNGDYCKDNCKWATRTEQNNNRRNNIILEHDGKIQTMGQWAKQLGIAYCTLKTRYYSGDTGDYLFRQVKTKCL